MTVPAESSERNRNCTAHCTSCDAHFTGLAPFDAHRVGGYCVDPSEPVFGENSRRARQPILQAIPGRCNKMPGCWDGGRLHHYVEGVALWQMSVDEADTLQGALFG